MARGVSNQQLSGQKVGVTGHQALPPAAAALVRARLLDVFPSADDVLVICSLAVGADTLVAEQMLHSGAQLRVIVPCDGYEATFKDDASLRQYKSLLAEASSVELLPFSAPSERAFLAAGRKVADECDLLLAVWDGQPARGLGGTADVVNHARSSGKEVEVVWPDGVSRS